MMFVIQYCLFINQQLCNNVCFQNTWNIPNKRTSSFIQDGDEYFFSHFFNLSKSWIFQDYKYIKIELQKKKPQRHLNMLIMH